MTRAQSPAMETLRAVRELHSTMESVLDAVAEQYGVNRSGLHCLEIVERSGAMNARELAQAAGLSPAAVTKVVDRLVSDGYVERQPDPHDRRAQVLRISGEHAGLRHGVWRPVEDAVKRALGGTSAGTLREFTQLLGRLSQVNREQAERLWAASDPKR